jgi:hypothetical protein
MLLAGDATIEDFQSNRHAALKIIEATHNNINAVNAIKE